MRFKLGDMFFSNLRCAERRSAGNYPKVIMIGGDRGDVEATNAELSAEHEHGVWLNNVVLISNWPGLQEQSKDHRLALASDIVLESYASVQGDTFNQDYTPRP